MSKHKRVVFDTNVLISAYLWPGTPRNALDAVRSGSWRLYSSISAIREFVRVLGYPKFGFSAEQIAPLIKDLESFITYVNPGKEIRAIPADPTDNIFISIAIEAGCPYIVSGDRHLLDLTSYEGTEIVTASKFIRLINDK